MLWEDFVYTVVGILFGYALLPQVYYGWKNKAKTIAKQTGILTTLGLILLIPAGISLGLVLSPIVTSVTTLLWAILTYQAFKYPDIEKIRKMKKG